MRAWFVILLWAGCASETDSETVLVTLRNDATPGALTASEGTTWSYVLAPGVLVVHREDAPRLFIEGEAAGPALIALAEDGDNAPLAAEVRSQPGIVYVGLVGAGDAYSTSPIEPGQSATLEYEIPVVEPGLYLSILTMFAQSNDVFLAPADGAIALIGMDGQRLSGDITGALAMFDAGSEMNEEPGIGATQAPRQSVAGEGEDESHPVTRIVDGTDREGFTYPPVEGNLSLTVSWRVE